jgi:hypothetical protein
MTRTSESTGAGATSAARPRLPDFFIVGHPKSGTTALYEMLRRHPQVYLPEMKEPRFFDADLRARFGPQGSRELPGTLEQYAALFEAAAPGQRLGDASPSYLRSQVAAREIAAVCPDARIVAIFREPVSFLRSLQLEMLQNRVESETDLRRALAAESLPASGDAPRGEARAPVAEAAPAVRYTDRVRYVEQLRRYEERFAPEQILVLIYEDFREDNAGTLRRVLRFLGVEETASLAPVEANPSVSVRTGALAEATRSLLAGRGPVGKAAHGLLDRVLPGGVRSRAGAAARRRLLQTAPEPIEEQLARELRTRFAPEVRALGEHLGRDLIALWGYDRSR